MWLLSSALAGEVIAVLPFAAHAVGDELAPLGAAASDMLVTDLARADGLVVVERARLNAVLAELQLQQSDFVDPASAARLGQGLGAGQVVVGSLSVASAGLRLDARVVDVASGTIVGTASASGSEAEFFAIEADVAQQLYGHFGVELTVGDAGKPRTLDEALTGGSRILAADDAYFQELQGVTVYRRERLIRRDAATVAGRPLVAIRTGSGLVLTGNQIAALPGVDPTPVREIQRRAKRSYLGVAAVSTVLFAGSTAIVLGDDSDGVDVAAGTLATLSGIGALTWIAVPGKAERVQVVGTVYSPEEVDAIVERHNARLAVENHVSERRRREIDAEPVRFD